MAKNKKENWGSPYSDEREDFDFVVKEKGDSQITMQILKNFST